MNQKQIGYIIIILGILIIILTLQSKEKVDQSIDIIIEIQNGSCYLEDGTCLHQDRSYTSYIFGWITAASLIILGIYLLFFDRTENLIKAQRQELTKELSESKKTKEFDAFLTGFSNDEKKVLTAINNQDGIKQSTLKFRTNLSKTSLSLILKDLEKSDVIKRKKSGKTNEVYLVRKF
jgi:uncharacterized membrane protein